MQWEMPALREAYERAVRQRDEWQRVARQYYADRWFFAGLGVMTGYALAVWLLT